jgi:hypothetical protein
MKPYITARLKVDIIHVYTDAVKGIITTIDQFLGVLAQSYKDLDETRTSEL